MDTTRPLDNAILNKDVATPAVHRVDAPDTATAPQRQGQPALAVSESMAATRHLLEVGGEAVRDIDMAQVDRFRSEIKQGTFTVDLGALTDRLVGDVLGKVIS